jgi:small-conductance mechanosensitive channel
MAWDPRRAVANRIVGSAHRNDVLLEALLLSAVVVSAALLLHRMLGNLGRRLLRAVARRRLPGAAGPPPHWSRRLQLSLLAPQAGIWAAAIWWLSERLPALREGRMAAGDLVIARLTAPLFTMNGHGYSAFDLLALPAVLAALWIGVSWLVRLLQLAVWHSAGVQHGAQATIAILVRYILTFLGAIVVLQAWDVDVSTLTIVASVLGVGIGLGLQNIANNFVSGLVLSLERPIQPGHFVRVGEHHGTIERIGARCTAIRTPDDVTILVPNSRFLESEVVNWSHGDPRSRVRVHVGVAYGTPTARVRSALLEAAAGHPDVLAAPQPEVEFRGFGESALDFELMVWTHEPQRQFHLQSDLCFRVEASLRRHGIAIPFPQRDLHLRAPELDVLVRALTRRHFTAEERAAASAPVPPAAQADAPEPHASGALDGRTWDDAELAALAARMRGPEGVARSDRRHLFTVYRQCFVGRDAVDWLCRTERVDRHEAVRIGRLLVACGAMHHVLDEHDFRDEHLFYRFVADETAAVRNPAARAASNGT